MGLTLVFRINLYSDYHVSAGHGLGAEVDSALLREADGVPVLRGTTLTGLLRDGVWRLLQLDPLKNYSQCLASGGDQGSPSYCGQQDPNQTDCPVCRLFGSSRRSKPWRIGSARPETLEVIAGPKSAWELRGPGGQVTRRVRVSPRSRRAEAHKLFAQEDGDARLSFCFEAGYETSDETALDDAALLVAAARFVRQLGRSRRRGRGECLITLLDVRGLNQVGPSQGQSYQDWLLARFEARWLSGDVRQPTQQADQPVPGQGTQAVSASSKTEPVRLRLIVRTDEPLLVARRAEAGNRFEALFVIPGSAVRGVLAGRAAARANLSMIGDYHDFVALLLRGEVIFPFLYPANSSPDYLYPSVPAPRDLLTCKARPGQTPKGHGVWGVTCSSKPETCLTCDEALTPVEGFVSLHDRSEFEPRRWSELHIRIEPESGRVVPGDLFTYIPLEAGQYFVGELICTNKDSWQKLQRLTGLTQKEPFPLRLGKANRRGYGGTTAWLEQADDAHSTWIGLPLPQRVADPKAPLALTLLTDTIVADAWGRFKLGFEHAYPDGSTTTWLIDQLRLGPLEVLGVYATTRLVDGFNEHLGLPRWRDLGVTAGSAVGFRLLDPPADCLKKMEVLERDGIGLRRNEGFGRIAFNHPVYPQWAPATDAAILLPEPMRLTSAPADYRLRKEWDFRERWAKILDKYPWEKWDGRFVALARWLHARKPMPREELTNQLDAVGQPDQALIQMIGEAEYGIRSKDNFFQTKGKAGLKQVRTLLIELAEKDSAYWLVGVAMLAERVAAAAVGKGGAQ